MGTGRIDALAPTRDALPPFVAFGAFFLIAAVAYYVYAIVWADTIPRDGSSLVVGRDFLLNFWMYGRAAWSSEPGRWYDVAAYQRELAAVLGSGYPGQNWSYPPSIMLLMAPFGRLPYLLALLLWTVLGIAAGVAVILRQLRDWRLVAMLATARLDLTGHVLVRLVYWLPLIQIGFGTLHVPGPALVAPAFALYIVLRLRAGRVRAPATRLAPRPAST